MVLFRKRRLAKVDASEGDSDPSRKKKQRIVGCVKVLLDIATESSDWFPPLKSALGGVSTLIKHYEEFEDVKEKIEDLIPCLRRFKQCANAEITNGDRAEKKRRSELYSAPGEIEKRSRSLLAKGVAARFVDKSEDSKEVAKLIGQVREAISFYQVSQQQAIYDQITDIASSFDVLLKLHERSPSVKKKLDSVMARLGRLCAEEGSWDTLQGDNEHERWSKLFGTLRTITDEGAVLRNRVSIQGYDECQSDILAVSGMAEDVRDVLLEYQTIHQRTIYDQNCRLINAVDLSVLNGCRRARGAAYQHGNRQGCLRGTREAVLDEIESWAKDFNKSPVFWLNGLAGTGKSTIAQTISERAFADGLLGASFFCSRDFKDRSDLQFIFPTLAFQLAHKYPDFRARLVSLLQSNPDIVDESLHSQMERLIVEPLRLADVSTVIVIDALDECNDDEPASAILFLLGPLVGRIPRVKFFVTGRPEPRIKSGFRLPFLKDMTNILALHDVHPSLINSDIRLFLKHELSELARRRRLEGWPSDVHINLLCCRAAGLFVYAVATVKFLGSNTHLPKRRLGVILGLPQCTVPEGRTQFKPNMTLDSLYASILHAAFSEEDPEVDSKVRSTIGAVILLVNPLPTSGIAELIGLDLEEVTLFLALIQSLLTIDDGFSQPVKPFHNSFPDFITDPFRCTEQRFYISPGNLHLELATNCLRTMNNGLEQNLLSLPNYALNSEVKDLQTRIKDRVSVALEYACRSWHNHLTKAVGDVAGIISGLRVFLKENFLAWLEVVSVLGAARMAVGALERLMSWIEQVTREEQLLNTIRDCFYFVTKFFEVIDVSATHIYHSALELSPLSSIVRKLYYGRRSTPFPRVAVGVPDSWDPNITISNIGYSSESTTWSPCGQFVATRTREALEIRDALTLELLPTIQPARPASQLTGRLAYSPDGRSIACASRSAIIIWDIQTGGVVEEIPCNINHSAPLVWSLDGRIISTAVRDWGSDISTLCRYGVAPGTTLPPITLQSEDRPRIWAHDESFLVMTATRDGDACTIDIFEVGFALTKIESFLIQFGGRGHRINSFSPTTCRISSSVVVPDRQLLVLDVRNSERLLMEMGDFESHRFSSDGSLFTASTMDHVHLWKYTDGRYTPWREFPSRDSLYGLPQFSPTSSSILVRCKRLLRVWRLDFPLTPLSAHGPRFATLSHSGTHIATATDRNRTVTIANLLSPTPSQIIDTGLDIRGLALTGNFLLVVGTGHTKAWVLTEEGTVDGVFGSGMAGPGNSIWTISMDQWRPVDLRFFAEGQIGVIGSSSVTPHIYHTRTGEVIGSSLLPFCGIGDWWGSATKSQGRNQPRYHGSDGQNFLAGGNWPVSLTTPEEGWVKDPAGNYRLWLPVEQRTFRDAQWFDDVATLQLKFSDWQSVIIKF